jgi:hypothetical protein
LTIAVAATLPLADVFAVAVAFAVAFAFLSVIPSAARNPLPAMQPPQTTAPYRALPAGFFFVTST